MVDSWFEGSLQPAKYWLLDQDCLGQSIVGRCGSTSLELTFPGWPTPDELPLMLSVPSVDFRDVVVDEHFVDDDEHSELTVLGLMNHELGVAAVFRCALRVKCPHAEVQIPAENHGVGPEGEPAWQVETDGATWRVDESTYERRQRKLEEVILTDVHSWLDATGIWLELLASVEVLAFTAARSEPPILRLCDEDDVRWELPIARDPKYSRLAVTEDSIPRITIDQWFMAATFATAGRQPPLAWRMYHQALRLAGDDPRLAVITACGAVEVSLAGRLREPLSILGAKAAERVVSQAAGLKGLVDLFKETFPNEKPSGIDFSGDLAHVRNLAAHQGQTPTKGQTDRALQVAKGMLCLVAGPPQDPKPGIT